MLPPLRALTVAASLAFALVPLPASPQAMFGPLGTGIVPNTMTHDDLDALAAAGAKLYTPDKVAVGTVERWTNPKTGNSGTVEMIREFQQNGMPCRRLEHHIKLAREGERTYTMNRCKTPEGEWKLAG